LKMMSKSKRQKNLRKKGFFGVLKDNDENNRIRIRTVKSGNFVIGG
jgi:hypothetical protein